MRWVRHALRKRRPWKALVQRSLFSDLVFVGFLLLIPAELARAETELEQLSAALSASPRVETVLPLLPKISSWLRDEATAFEALPLAERAAEILLPTAAETGNWPSAASLLKASARLRFAQAEPNIAAKHLQSLRQLYRLPRERFAPDDPDRLRARETFGHASGGVGRPAPNVRDGVGRPAPNMRESPQPETALARLANEVALEYLRGEQTNFALEVLGESVDRAAQSPTSFDETEAAVAGALHRRLEQLHTSERYELLYSWSMPTDGRRTLRDLTSSASVEAPPDVFARALGERPRANAFPIPQVGGVEGLFSTSWLLVCAAAESGRLRRLTTELEDLAKAKVPHSDFVLLLARITEDSSSVNELQTAIDMRLEKLAPGLNTQKPSENGVSSPGLLASADELQLMVIGAACLERQPLRQTGQRVFEKLAERITDDSSPYARPFLRRARAIAILRQHDGADSHLLADPELKFWIPASEENAVRSAAGAVREIWLLHEDHILHLAGPHNDYLCFRYPLSGDFEFQVEAQNGGKEHTFGNLAFGGLAYGVAGNADELRVWGLDMGQMMTRPFPFVRKEPWATYQRLAIHSSDKGAVHLVNGRPVWTDVLRTSTSPWLALRCFGDHIPAFRNFRLTGNPVIPREVRMSDGNLLRGWFTQFYPCNVSRDVPLTESAVRPYAAAQGHSPGLPQSPPTSTQFDWFLRDGVIHGSHRDELFRAAVPSRLTYFRPLQSDESIHYEFFYEPGKQEVHPGLGRLAFLIEPNGVRVRWMVSGETEWTGLAENNATIEPLNRRGPRPLPLKSREWNRVTMTLNKDVLSLTLNDLEIYSRKTEAENSRRFSFYHDRNRSTVQVRNVVLRGAWPEALSEDDLKNLLVPFPVRQFRAAEPF